MKLTLDEWIVREVIDTLYMARTTFLGITGLDSPQEVAKKSANETAITRRISQAIDIIQQSEQPHTPESLEEAAENIYKTPFGTRAEDFIAGAEWQYEQFEKNRLANCDKLTKEEYDRETDFALEIVENERRQPTFTDAINYRMRVMKEYLMNEAVEGVVEDWNPESHPEITIPLNPEEFTMGDKVKLIVIKEDEK